MKRAIKPGLEMGFDDEGQGIPLVLLHGFPLARAMWQPQGNALRGSQRVLLPDLRGLGETSGFDGIPSIDQMADDVAALLDHLQIAEPVVLGGLSMGGYVSLAFARRHPQRLRGLILADTRAEADGAEARTNRDKMIALVEKEGPGAVIEQMLPKLVAPATLSRRADVVTALRRMGQAQTTAGVANAVRALRDRPDSTPGLRDIRVPTLVIVGEEDGITPPSAAAALTAGIAGARQVVIPHAGHMSNMEQPAAFNEAVREFLGGLR